MSTGSSELSEQAETLQQAISFFKIGSTQESGRRPASAQRKKGYGQNASAARPSASNKPRNGNGIAIDMGADNLGADHLDKDFKVYQ
jgi:methyl-accepting chemotaxis protein